MNTPGASLSIRAGRLIAAPHSQTFPPHDHALRTIIFAASGYVTTAALAWLAKEHVTLIAAHDGEVLVMADCAARRLARGELAARRRQMECVFDPARRLAVARAIVAAKIVTMKLPEAMAKEALAEAAEAPSIEDAMVIEAHAAAAYWRRWQRMELRFNPRTAPSPVPDSWLTFDTRARSWRTGRLGETGTQFSNRFALHPLNAMINYAGAIVVAQCTWALAGLGFDPAFGVLHSARPGMAALAWDAFELLRVRVTEVVFGFAAGRVFKAKEFWIEREPKPHIRFGLDVARELTAYVARQVTVQDVVKSCRSIAKMM